MKLATKLATNVVVAGGMLGAALLLKRLVRSRRGAHETPTDETGFGRFAGRHDEPGYEALSALDDDLRAIATESGIANVDPEPISHVAGEGIDLDRDVAAHREIADLRERLPRH
jgi:hypothetical protein